MLHWKMTSIIKKSRARSKKEKKRLCIKCKWQTFVQNKINLKLYRPVTKPYRYY